MHGDPPASRSACSQRARLRARSRAVCVHAGVTAGVAVCPDERATRNHGVSDPVAGRETSDGARDRGRSRHGSAVTVTGTAGRGGIDRRPIEDSTCRCNLQSVSDLRAPVSALSAPEAARRDGYTDRGGRSRPCGRSVSRLDPLRGRTAGLDRRRQMAVREGEDTGFDPARALCQGVRDRW